MIMETQVVSMEDDEACSVRELPFCLYPKTRSMFTCQRPTR